MSGTELAFYWILLLVVGGFGTFLWWKSQDLEYVESRPPGILKGFLLGYRRMPRWIVPVLVPMCLLAMIAATILG